MPRQIGTKRVEVEDVVFVIRWSFNELLAMQTWAETEKAEKGEGGLAETMTMLEKLIISWEGFVDQDGVEVAYSPDKLGQLDPDLVTGLFARLMGGTPGEAPGGNTTAGSSEPTDT